MKLATQRQPQRGLRGTFPAKTSQVIMSTTVIESDRSCAMSSITGPRRKERRCEAMNDWMPPADSAIHGSLPSAKVSLYFHTPRLIWSESLSEQNIPLMLLEMRDLLKSLVTFGNFL